MASTGRIQMKTQIALPKKNKGFVASMCPLSQNQARHHFFNSYVKQSVVVTQELKDRRCLWLVKPCLHITLELFKQERDAFRPSTSMPERILDLDLFGRA